MLHSKCLHLCCTRNLCLTSVHMHYYAVFNCTITDSFSIGPLLSSVQRMGSNCLMSPYSVIFFSCIVQCVTIALFTACYSNTAEAIIIHFLVFFFSWDSHHYSIWMFINFSLVSQVSTVRQRDICPPTLQIEHQGRGQFRLEDDTQVVVPHFGKTSLT